MKRIKGFKYNKKEKFYYYGDQVNGIRVVGYENEKFIATCFVSNDFFGPFGPWDTIELAIEEMMKTYLKLLEK